jgi:hypothetical protein
MENAMRHGSVKVCAVVLLGVCAGMMFAPGAQAQNETAGQMATYCAPYRHALRLAPRAGGGTIVEAPGGNAKSDFCWGAFATMQEVATLRQVGAIEFYVKGQPNRKICLPMPVERLQMVKAFLQYMGDHQSLGNADFGVALLYSMLQAFPCAPGT